jgi:hypothetical protein
MFAAFDNRLPVPQDRGTGAPHSRGQRVASPFLPMSLLHWCPVVVHARDWAVGSATIADGGP